MLLLKIKLASIGEIGENNIAFELKNSGMPMYVMNDIHFEIGGLSAQIDYIVVTRKVNFVIECKNLIGDIDSDGNFIRNYELKEELQGVSGFGQVKAEKYGDMILKILNESK